MRIFLEAAKYNEFDSLGILVLLNELVNKCFYSPAAGGGDGEISVCNYRDSHTPL